MHRQATVLIADEIYFNLYGKIILQGIYNNDLVIPKDPSSAPQLIFYFDVQTGISEPFHSLSVEVALPEAEPVKNIVFVLPPQLIIAQAKAQPERTVYSVRHPLLIANPVLRAGHIIAKVIHEKGEMTVTAPWITLPPPPQTAKSN